MGKLGIGKNWIGMLIVAGAFIFGIISYSVFGDLGLGEFGALVYLVPLIALVGGLFAWLSRVQK